MEIRNGKGTNRFHLYEHWARVSFNGFETNDIHTWFRKNCSDDVTITASHVYFKNEQDAILFRLGNRRGMA